MGKKQFKLSLLGEGGVGKTSLKARYMSGEFTDKYIATLGVDFATHEIQIDGSKVKISIWDVAGQKQFRSIRKSFFEGSRGGLLIFDVTRKETFTDLASTWIKPFWETLGDKVPCILIANKIDLSDQRKVTREEAETFAKQLSEESGFTIPYVETSAKEGTNVNGAFEELSRTILSKYD